ncbi:MAG: rRNA pseudouridine synthase [Planctomycetes bacterium]|nr:rRNA pseudouridine synthase [Planctomycetota bacterium]
MSERLDGFLAHRGFGTRSQARDLVRGRLVSVDGLMCRDPSLHITDQVVTVEGRVIAAGVDTATLLLHKPVGFACSHDPDEAPLLDELIPDDLRHLALQSAGRLDRDTSGMIIVTTQGELIHALTNPRRHVLKRYRLLYRGKLSHHAVARVAKGMVIEGDPKPTLPARLELEGVGDDGTGRATIHLSEGRYHQVRRMIAELGGEVVALHRDRIGSLELPAELAAGMVRTLSDEERAQLFVEPG